MKLKILIPNVFYTDIRVGLRLFVECLGCAIIYQELESADPFCVVGRDGVKLHLIQSEEYAMKDRPELRIETDDIEALYTHIRDKHPDMLHPNLPEITLRDWNAKEFALLDESHVCVVVQQWV
ncbi:VOC family protein [Deminuibacter soli]|uniref:Uncharacterized protein n=1 Tax=Deminuibacter soli TaxID=2291815 RepID=A0A3E1NKA4_9BACT|nr:hypothetical protein [Deminuibacter soli]RFM28254.1 hypothetical protein DXN05_12120 [Deminuibacter soli]